MIKVNVKNAGNLDKALKQLKQKMKKSNVIGEYRDRQEYLKPSVKKRKLKKKAIYKSKMNKDN